MSKHSSATTIDRILVAARAAFTAHGIDGARLDSIARDAGVTKQLVYHYFKSKEELYSLVLEQVAEEILGVLDDPKYETLPPDEAIRLFIEHLFDAFVQRPYMVAMTLDEALHRGEHVSRRSRLFPVSTNGTDLGL